MGMGGVAAVACRSRRGGGHSEAPFLLRVGRAQPPVQKLGTEAPRDGLVLRRGHATG